MNILVVGGAGYIGSHMVKYLGEKGCRVTTLDNLSSGYKDAVLFGKFVLGDLADQNLLNNLFNTNQFDAVMHFASYIQVGESVKSPATYYQNNLVNTLNLLNTMKAYEVKKFIFSSTAATFGNPLYTPIDELHPQNPINPYGSSKLMVEQILKHYDEAYDFKSVSLRYFNAAGADPEGLLGERHNPETHLIPLILQTALNKKSHITVYGNDYETKDGTCIRDYIHVADLCEAHWLALQSLIKNKKTQFFNLGNGDGFSVLDVIKASELVTGHEIKVLNGSRREGDPAYLVADSRLAQECLGWKPKYKNLTTIIKHAWNWQLLNLKS